MGGAGVIGAASLHYIHIKEEIYDEGFLRNEYSSSGSW